MNNRRGNTHSVFLSVSQKRFGPLCRTQEVKMKKAILTTKVGMTQIFNEDGVLVPVTVLQAGPCVVTQVKTVENDAPR